MLSARLIVSTLAASAVVAAPASAADPLLSGYSGPGGVEQTLLGGDTGSGTGGGGNGGGGGGSQPAAERPLALPAGAGQTTVTPAGTAVQSAAPSSGGSGKASGGGSTQGATPADGGSAAATAVRYPERAAEAGGSGLPEGAIPALVLGLLVVLGLALSMRRLAAPRIA